MAATGHPEEVRRQSVRACRQKETATTGVAGKVLRVEADGRKRSSANEFVDSIAT
jgi:hypothetical protein